MRDKIDPATVIGRGKIEEVKIEAQLHKAPLVIFDRNLTPTQLRNLESGTDCRVIDRTQLILDIFARPRSQPGRATASRTCPTQLHAAAPRRKRKRTFPAGRRHRHTRPWPSRKLKPTGAAFATGWAK